MYDVCMYVYIEYHRVMWAFNNNFVMTLHYTEWHCLQTFIFFIVLFEKKGTISTNSQRLCKY